MYLILDEQRKTKSEKRKTAGQFALPFFVLLFSLFVCVPGCQGIQHEQPPAPVNDTPLVVDEAMQVRDWDRTTNYYANGATVAGGTGYVWEVADWVDSGHRRFVDAPVALLNMLSMPVGIFLNSPFGEQVARGETVPPTYTGQPPLPGKPVPVNREAVMEPIAPPAPEPTEAPPTPPAPPAVETPAPQTIETPPPPVETAPPPAPVTPVTPEPAPPAPVTPTTPEPAPPPAPSDPITPAPAPPPPSAVEPVEPVTPVTPAPPASPAPPPTPGAPPPQ